MPRLLHSLPLLLLSSSLLPAQQVSPEVQNLYADAQAAQAANHPDRAIADYRKILKLAPDLAAAYNNLGRLLYNAGDLPGTIATLSKGLEINPDMPPARIMLGASYLQLGQPQQARPLLEAGVAAMPDDRFARMSLARTLIALDQPEAATDQLQTLLKSDPKDQEAWYLLGKLHLQLSQQAFAQVQHIDDNTALAHQLEGEIMESMNNTPGAVDAYKQALAVAPHSPEAQLHLADLYWHTGNWSAARDSYQTLLQQQPGNCSVKWKLANSLNELAESPDRALSLLNDALAQCPSIAQAHADRARLLLRAGKPQDALADLKLAEAAAPGELSVQQLLAQTYRALGDRASADRANQRYLALQKAMHQASEQHAAQVIQANQ